MLIVICHLPTFVCLCFAASLAETVVLIVIHLFMYVICDLSRVHCHHWYYTLEKYTRLIADVWKPQHSCIVGMLVPYC